MTLVRIDIAAHILPARYFGRLQQIPGFYLAKRVKGVRCLFDLTVRFQIMDAFGEYRQVLSLAAPPIVRRGMPIFLHPARGADFPDYPAETESLYDLWQIFGWPYETTIAMARLVFTGLFDRHPDAVIITHHMGGLVPHFADRIRGGYDQFGTRGPEHQMETFPIPLAHPPAWYFTRFYADTALFGAPHAVRCGLAYFPADRVLFGTDTPFDVEGG